MANRDNEDLTWLRETSPTTNREDVVNSSVDLMMVSGSFSVLLSPAIPLCLQRYLVDGN